MDWGSLVGPAVVAAVISGIVTCIGMLISARTTNAIHKERLAFEHDQSERQVSAEIALAKEKVMLDHELAAWKRKTEFAEEVLADFYRLLSIFKWVRTQSYEGLLGEGESLKAEPGEELKDTRYRQAIYGMDRFWRAQRMERSPWRPPPILDTCSACAISPAAGC
jgi:hypothetical protein